MSKIDEIMEQLQTLTLLEAAELVEKIEETFYHFSEMSDYMNGE